MDFGVPASFGTQFWQRVVSFTDSPLFVSIVGSVLVLLLVVAVFRMLRDVLDALRLGGYQSRQLAAYGRWMSDSRASEWVTDNFGDQRYGWAPAPGDPRWDDEYEDVINDVWTGPVSEVPFNNDWRASAERRAWLDLWGDND